VVNALLFIFAQNSSLLRLILVYIYQTFTLLIFLDNIVQNKILCNFNCLDKICIKISVGSNFILISVIDKF
jgi:hypothetical protein